MTTGRSILAVRGLDTTGQNFRSQLFNLALNNGWNVDALAAVMSLESGFEPSIQNPLPGQTASGLIQMTDATARGLGIVGGAAAVRHMSASEQLPWVEKYYQRAFRNLAGPPRNVDYYAALVGSGVGAPESYVYFRASDPLTLNGGTANLYLLNSGLDSDRDGAVSVGDLGRKVQGVMSAAQGQRLSAEPETFLASDSLFPWAILLTGIVLWSTHGKHP